MPSQRTPEVMSDEEFNLLVKTIKEGSSYMDNFEGRFLRMRDSTAIQLMNFCGLRPAEALLLKWTDISFEKSLIYVKVYYNKQRNNTPAILTKPGEDLLIKYKEHLDKLNINSPYLFPTLNYNRPSTTPNFSRRIRQVMKEARILKISYVDSSGNNRYNYRTYTMRHNFGTKCFKTTGSELATSRMLRHTQVASAGFYVHLDNDSKRKIADMMYENDVNKIYETNNFNLKDKPKETRVFNITNNNTNININIIMNILQKQQEQLDKIFEIIGGVDNVKKNTKNQRP